jgi:hypothetical protein
MAAGSVKLKVNVELGDANRQLKKLISIIDKAEKSGGQDLKALSSDMDHLEKEIKQTTSAQKKMGSSMGKQKKGVSGVGAALGGYTLAIGAAVQGIQAAINVTSEWVSLSNEQEKAENNLTAALRARGLDDNIQEYKEYASQIQRVTTLGDEQVLQIQKTLAGMGEERGSINDTTEMIIGLSKAYEGAGLQQKQAIKGIMNARQGDFNTLKRYIPELRTAKNETEAMAILQRKSAEGFKIAQAETEAGAGKLQQFSNLVGDLKEDFGDFIKVLAEVFIDQLQPILINTIDFIEKNRDTITKVIKVIGTVIGTFVKFVVGYFKQTIKSWSDLAKNVGEGSLVLTKTFQELGTIIKKVFDTIIQSAVDFGKIFYYIATGQFGKVKQAFTDMTSNLKEGFSGVGDRMKKVFDRNKKYVADTAKQFGKGLKDAYIKPFAEGIDEIANIVTDVAEPVKKAGEKTGDNFGKGFKKRVNDILEKSVRISLMERDDADGIDLPVTEEPETVDMEIDVGETPENLEKIKEIGTETFTQLGSLADNLVGTAIDDLVDGTDNLNDMLDNLDKKLLKLALNTGLQLLISVVSGGAATSLSGLLPSILGFSGGGSITGFAGGTEFVVPPGFPNDSFKIGNIGLSSGEALEMNVRKPNDVRGGSGITIENNLNGPIVSDRHTALQLQDRIFNQVEQDYSLFRKE